MTAATALVLIVLAGFVVWRASLGPISISAITPYIETALSDPATGRRVSIGASSLIWDRDEMALEVRADHVTVIDPGGQAVLSVPELTLRFSGPALLRGILAPREINLIRPDLEIVRSADSSWAIMSAPTGNQPGDGANLPLSWTDANRQLAPVDRFRIVDARVTIDDRRAHAVWVAPRVSLRFQRARGKIDGEASLDLDLDGQTVPLRLAGRFDPGGNRLDAELGFGNLILAGIGRRITELSPLAALDLPLAGKVRFAGTITGADQTIQFDITGGAGRIVRPELVDGSLPVDGLSARGRYEAAGERLELAGFALNLPTTSISLAGTAHDLSGDAAAEGIVNVPTLALDDLGKYWPPDVAVNPRRWILANLTHGMVRDVAAQFAVRQTGAGGDIDLERLDGTLAVEGARVRYLETLPPIEKVAATAHFDSRRFDITVRTGRLRGLRIEDGRIAITGLETTDQRIAINTTVAGPVTDALVVLDMPPLGYVRRFGMSPQNITGDMTAQESFRFPLISKLSLDDLIIGATATLRGLRVPKAVRDMTLSDGDFDLKLDKDGLGMIGDARLEGIPTHVAWTENFGRGAPFRRRYEASATLSDAQRQSLGVDLPDRVVGPVGINLTYTDVTNHRATLSGTADLSAAALKLTELGWTKSAGQAINGRADAELIDGRFTTLNHAELDGAGLVVRGQGSFGDQNQLSHFDIQELKAGETDVAGAVGWQGDALDLSLTGRSFDASALLAESDSGKPRRMTISAKLDRVLFGPGRRLDNVDLRAGSDGQRWRTASITGLAGQGSMVLNLIPRDGGRNLTVFADDAGAAVQLFGLGDDVRGGKLRVDGTYDDRGPIDKLTAHVAIENYRVVHAPLLANLLAVTSITGIPELLTGEGIAFQDLTMNLTKQSDDLEIIDARASGLALGLTAQGHIRGPDEIADLSGTIVPIYSLNRLVAAIPLIGEIVTGGGGGLFAFTYKVQGPLAHPKISVNPLSVLAPGFLRNLFKGLPGISKEANPPRSLDSR